LTGLGDLLLPALIIGSGSYLNTRLTKKMPLIAAWAGTFALQALVRSLVFGTPLVPALLPMTGVAYILFSFYMVSDPATTPMAPRRQVLFGAAVALVYGVLLSQHVVFTIFFALTLVCLGRGICLYVEAWRAARARLPQAAETAHGLRPAAGRALRPPISAEESEGGGSAPPLPVPEGM
jgi:hypothetical protein